MKEVAPQLATKPFRDELLKLLRERDLSRRTLAKRVGVGDDHLSRVLRGDRGKRASASLARRVAIALDLPEDYFIEARLAIVRERLASDPALLQRVYEELPKRRATPDTVIAERAKAEKAARQN